MPTAIIGGISFILYGMISAIGVRNVVENKVDFTKSRNLIIAAVILVSGLGFSEGITFKIAGTYITLTALAIAALLGIIMNAILPGKDYEFGMVEENEDNGNSDDNSNMNDKVTNTKKNKLEHIESKLEDIEISAISKIRRKCGSILSVVMGKNRI